MSITQLTLTDASGNVYTFPGSFWLNKDRINTNQNVVNTFYAAGGRNIADGFLKARVISVSGVLRADTTSEFETAKRDLMQAALKGGQLKKTIDEVSRYIDVAFPNFSVKREEGRRYQEYNIDFVVEYPFWEDAVQTQDINIVTGNTVLSINNDGSDFLVLPIITVEANQGVDIPSVKMVNRSDGAMEFQYNDSDFQSGDTLTIDCEEGTVKLNNNPDAIVHFNPARFFRLQPGINTINYEGNACTINFKFRKVYL